MKDILIRAGKTFLQAFFSVLSLGVAGVVDVDTAKSLLVAAVAAGVSAVMNVLRDIIGAKKA